MKIEHTDVPGWDAILVELKSRGGGSRQAQAGGQRLKVAVATLAMASLIGMSAAVTGGIGAAQAETDLAKTFATTTSGTNTFVAKHDPGSRAASSKPIRLAQAKTKLIAKAEVTAKPGSTIDMPVRFAPSTPIDATSHVIIDGTPEWMSLSAGESVGDGVWLLRANQLSNARITLSAAASGESRMGVLLVNKDGKVTGETQFLLRAQGGRATARAKPPTTWQSLVGGGKKAAAAPALPSGRKTLAPAPPKTKTSAWTAPKKKFKRMSRAKATAYAKHLVRECTTCHSLYGEDDGIPVMVGLKVDRFIDTLGLYRRGKRDNLVMINVSRSLDDQQIRVLADYLGGIQPPPKRVAKRSGGRVATAGVASAGRGAGASSTTRKRHTKRKITPAKLNRAERWVTKGAGLLNAGRVAQARLWFKRAADYGIAEAAMLLGTSFDPNFLQSNAGLGLTAKPNRARDWYIYARQLGSQVAAQRLAALPAG